MGTTGLRHRALRGIGMLTLVAAIGACTPIVRNHGYIPLEQDLAQIQIGVDTRETVSEAIGTPTAGGVLDGTGYYYIASQFRHYGFFAPQEVSREVLAISFSPSGTVSNIERFGLEEGRVVALSRRVTSSGVRDTTLIRQLLGNIGNFNPGLPTSDG